MIGGRDRADEHRGRDEGGGDEQEQGVAGQPGQAAELAADRAGGVPDRRAVVCFGVA
ncbi:hypothetical protein GCM10009609_62700 [Pseudonocardia aurantiaca]|uniref:Uncharacterized protein n=1 Tax=Pseudonocardia aurantiaca TaxID=75290 RepID=A0ABW4FS68_9PSEU